MIFKIYSCLRMPKRVQNSIPFSQNIMLNFAFIILFKPYFDLVRLNVKQCAEDLDSILQRITVNFDDFVIFASWLGYA